MGIYIIEDDDTMIEILEDLIEDHEMGEVVGSSTDPSEALLKVPAIQPDIILIDFLMPGKDGAQLVRELKEAGCTAKFIMVSQVSSKDMIGKAYDAGIEFFISKPINLIEVKSILNTVTQQIKNERTVAQLRNLFMTEIGFGDGKGAEAGSSTGTAPAVRNTPEQKTPAEIRQGSVPQGAQPRNVPGEPAEDEFTRNVEQILVRIGMAGEKGSADIVRVCTYLNKKGISMRRENVRNICGKLSDAPKSMEQRMRRAVQTALTNLAHLGIEDFMNDTFTEYSSTLFLFEEVRAEMDYVRGKRPYGGKVSLKKFIESLMIQAERPIN